MRWLSTLILPLLISLTCEAQPPNSILINRTEGVALLDGHPAQGAISSGGLLTTADSAYAEVLLGPGLFLRVGPDAAIRFASWSVDIERGEVLLDLVAVPRETASLTLAGLRLTPRKPGLYELDAEARRLRVYAGELAGVKKGDRADIHNGTLAVSRFDNNQADALYVWSARMAELSAAANYALVAAGPAHKESGWYWNEKMRCWSYLPHEQLATDSFGWLYLANRRQLATALLLNGPFTGFLAAVDKVNPPRILHAPALNASVDLAHAKRLDRTPSPATAYPPMDPPPVTFAPTGSPF